MKTLVTIVNIRKVFFDGLEQEQLRTYREEANYWTTKEIKNEFD